MTLRRIKLFLLLIFSTAAILLWNGESANASIVADGFDFPLGKPDGKGYGVECCSGLSFLERYDYTGDGRAEYHPGEDWNDDNSGADFGGNKDEKGDPVFSIANGEIKFAAYGGKSWGYLVLIEHNLPNGQKIWSQYAHMQRLATGIAAGDVLPRGAEVGFVGDYPNGSGRSYHLHFELRKRFRPANDFVMNWSKENVLEYYLNPSEFINSHRPPKGQELSLSREGGGVKLNWTDCEGDLDHYELYRSTEEGGTKIEAKRTLISSSSNLTTFFDSKPVIDATNYYRLFTFYKNGMVGESNEVSAGIQRSVTKIT